jgi:hypothetical protein
LEWLSNWLVSDYSKTLQLIRELGPIVVALIAAFIASIIQYRQWKTADMQREIAKNKISLDLYDRRFAVYVATREFLASVIGPADLNHNDHRKYVREIWHARFLFDAEFVRYLDGLRMTAVSIGTYKATYEENLKNPDRGKLIDQNQSDLTRIHDEMQNLEIRFLPYLDFSHLR